MALVWGLVRRGRQTAAPSPYWTWAEHRAGRPGLSPSAARGRERRDLDSPAAGATIIEVQGGRAPATGRRRSQGSRNARAQGVTPTGNPDEPRLQTPSARSGRPFQDSPGEAPARRVECSSHRVGHRARGCRSTHKPGSRHERRSSLRPSRWASPSRRSQRPNRCERASAAQAPKGPEPRGGPHAGSRFGAPRGGRRRAGESVCQRRLAPDVFVCSENNRCAAQKITAALLRK